MKLATHMRPATGQFNGLAAAIGKGAIGGIPVTLNGAGKGGGNDIDPTPVVGVL